MSRKSTLPHTIPEHVAIIMDGNGRWAKKRFLPRTMGHKAGVNRLHEVISHSGKIGVKVLTLFAFGRENWSRPQEEVSVLMGLFTNVLISEVKKLHQNNVQLKVVGDRSRLAKSIVEGVAKAEALTQDNTGLKLRVAIDYSGCWDIVTAAKSIAKDIEKGVLKPEDIDESLFAGRLQTLDTPNVDLLIRTSGEHRISNFMLWQIAYAELYFTEVLWPDFKSADMDDAINFFNQKERRFGKTSEQLK